MDEFCQTTGYHRKYAIAILHSAGKTQLRRIGKQAVKVRITATARSKRVHKRFYDGPVETAILAVWEFFRFVCGKRLAPMVRDNLEALSKHKRFRSLITADVKPKLLKISRSTVERMLGRERERKKTKGTSATKPGTLLIYKRLWTQLLIIFSVSFNMLLAASDLMPATAKIRLRRTPLMVRF